MNRVLKSLAITCAAAVFAPPAASAPQDLPRDGWATWEVPATPDTPSWCCYEGGKDYSVRATCKLDGPNYGFSSGSKDREEMAGSIRMYARFEAGKLTKLRTFAASCPVAADSPIKPLSNMTPNVSVKWLLEQVKAEERSRVGSEAIGAIAAHQGNLARDTVATIAKSDGNVKNRKDAIFWLTQVRGAEGFDIVTPYLFDDADRKVREHAAFALSQSRARPAAPLLVRAANNDSDTHVRSQAWFWLAQTKWADTEKTIRGALSKEQDQRVREQMIFALSQLPAERAAPALIGLVEDKSLAREDRKKAVFWMGQMKSDLAVN